MCVCVCVCARIPSLARQQRVHVYVCVCVFVCVCVCIKNKSVPSLIFNLLMPMYVAAFLLDHFTTQLFPQPMAIELPPGQRGGGLQAGVVPLIISVLPLITALCARTLLRPVASTAVKCWSVRCSQAEYWTALYYFTTTLLHTNTLLLC